MKKLLSKLLLILGGILVGSNLIFAEGQDLWQYSKNVSYENKEELKAIYLDEEVYRHANSDLSDIRLIAKDDQVIPYYIYNGFTSENKVEGLMVYTSNEILTYIKDNHYYVDYKINAPEEKQDIVGNTLAFELENTFYKEVKVLGSYDNKTWEHIKTDMIYNINGQEKMLVSLGQPYKYPYYRIVSLNDMTGIKISGLSLIYNQAEPVYEAYTRSKAVEYETIENKEQKETLIKIHNKNRLKVNGFTVQSKGDFNRDYKLYIKQGEEDDFHQAGTGSIYQFNLGEVQIQDTRILVDEAVYSLMTPEYFELVIQNRDDRPIEIEEIQISYKVDKIVFKTSDRGDLQLLFGNKTALKPDYDITSYLIEMEQSNQEKAVLSELVRRDIEEMPEEARVNVKLILNISVIIISGLLVVLILRKK